MRPILRWPHAAMGVALLLSLLSHVTAAFAHPHIWIEARSVIAFTQDGAIKSISHEWTFDEAFSAWSVQGLDTDGDGEVSEAEFAELARENILGLASFDYYTYAGTAGSDVSFAPVGDPRMAYDNGRVTLYFTLVPREVLRVSDRLEIEVTDPEYYAAFSFADGGARLENAPASCAVTVNPPKPVDPVIEDRLSALGPDVVELPDDLRAAAADLANALILTCGGGGDEVQPALEAIEQVATEGNRPFAAPPAERGLPVARTGILGWINTQQQAFYGALTRALGAIRTDNNAFFVLGALSFLYGIFHAAGPGHGKLVVSSYMLATEAEVKRGIALSFASALVQALTAVVFVSLAAAVLNLSSSALSSASNILIIGSYVLVVLLGLWLLARKLFGFGHHHHGHHHGHDHAAHDHDHTDHAHAHAVTPAQTRGSWREMVGVVMAVGLRPCSGALVVLVFALSQGVFAAGIVATFLMGLGTALTVSLLAIVAVGIKAMPRVLPGARSSAIAASVVWWLELFGAVLVLGFGVLLLLANL